MVVSSHQDIGRAINPVWFQAAAEQINREPWKSEAAAVRARASRQPSAGPSHGCCREPRAREGGRRQPRGYSRSFFGKGCTISACTRGSCGTGSLAAPAQTREPCAFGSHAQSRRGRAGDSSASSPAPGAARAGGVGSAPSPEHGCIPGTRLLHWITSLPLQR